TGPEPARGAYEVPSRSRSHRRRGVDREVETGDGQPVADGCGSGAAPRADIHPERGFLEDEPGDEADHDREDDGAGYAGELALGDPLEGIRQRYDIKPVG